MKTIRLFVAAIVLMAMTVTRRVIVVLDFPADIDDFITYAKAIQLSMTSSSYFSALSVKLNTLNIDIAALEAAQAGVNATLPTHTTAQRDEFLLIVKNDLRGLKLDVQALVDADSVNAEAIVQAADMKVKQQGAINKQDFEVKRGDLSGTAKLIAKGKRERYANDWAMSQDGTNWVPIDPTLAATTIVSGLTRAQILDFRHRYILKDGPTDWLYFNDFVVT